MKTRITFVAAVAMGAMSLMTSCSNESLDAQSDSVMLEAEVSGIAKTRAAVEGTSLPAGSEYGLYVFDGWNVVANNVKMAANSTATGYLITGDSKVKVGAYYPYDENAKISEDVLIIYPGTTDYLHTIESNVYTKSNPKASIQLHHALARVRFNVSVASDAKESYKVSFNSLEKVYTQGYMRLGLDGGASYGSYGSIGTLKLDKPVNDEIKYGSTLSTEEFLIPQDLKYYPPYVSITVNGDTKDISQDIINATSSLSWDSGKIYTYNITIKEGAKLSVSAATIEEWGETENMESVTVHKDIANGHEYVDLGLPSGNLWATCNIGATTPTYSGDFFAWGETKKKNSYTKDNYSYTENPEVLPKERDAASVNWGGEWSIPTYDDFVELYQECTWKSEDDGYVVKSKKNDNSIFIPLTGYKYSMYLENYKYFYYWTSSLSAESSVYAWAFTSFGYYAGVQMPQSEFRYYGYCIRPVIKK